MVLTHSLLIQLMPGTPAGFQAMVGKQIFFDKIRLSTLVFSLPTLPYVMVAHRAHHIDLVHLYQHRVWRDNLIAHHYTFIDIIIFIFRKQDNNIYYQINTFRRLPEKHMTH